MTVLWLQRIFMQVKKQIHDQNVLIKFTHMKFITLTLVHKLFVN